MAKCLIFLCCFFLYYITLANCENDTEKWPTLQSDWEYCYEFTWFGPDFTNVTKYNGTCADYLEETRADGVPCASPVVISYDGTPPNMDYLWEKYRASILCKRSQNQRCVRYTYYLDNMVNNITYMCAKVQASSSGSIVNEGCYKEKAENGYQREVCVCTSTKGIYPPCNSVGFSQISLGLVLICVVWDCIVKKYLCSSNLH